MELNNDFFKKVEKKTRIDKDTIISLAKKLNEGNLKDENTLREVIQKLGSLTNKDVTKEKEDKIIDVILKDYVPSNIDKMF